MTLYYPLWTKVFDDISSFNPPEDTLYIYDPTVEERAKHVLQWSKSGKNVTIAEIVSFDDSHVSCDIDGVLYRIGLKTDDIVNLAHHYNRPSVCLDITGMEHRVWAPLVKSALNSNTEVTAVYAEPRSYTQSIDPVNDVIYDLSEKVQGISPLPGFATVYRSRRYTPMFIPILGFEGTRFSYILEQVQPNIEYLIPIVGMPSFQPDYVFRSFQCNMRSIRELGAWPKIKYVQANCACSMFYSLLEMLSAFSDAFLQIALIGTKPHALGAITLASLFSLTENRVEIIYDHPIRSSSRTTGIERILQYNLSELFAIGKSQLNI